MCRTSGVPRRLLVTGVTHVKQAKQYLKYDACRKRICQQLANHGRFRRVDGLKTWTDSESKICAGLDHSKNEVLLFHGTGHAGAEEITKGSFRVDLAGTLAGSAFGRGLYYAESCIKSDEYAQCKHNKRDNCSVPSCTGERPLLLCRVALGRCKYTAEYRPNPRKLEEACGVNGGTGDCHSVLADREEANRRKGNNPTFREFIVFDPDQVYTEYIVWYRRD